MRERCFPYFSVVYYTYLHLSTITLSPKNIFHFLSPLHQGFETIFYVSLLSWWKQCLLRILTLQFQLNVLGSILASFEAFLCEGLSLVHKWHKSESGTRQTYPAKVRPCMIWRMTHNFVNNYLTKRDKATLVKLKLNIGEYKWKIHWNSVVTNSVLMNTRF